MVAGGEGGKSPEPSESIGDPTLADQSIPNVGAAADPDKRSAEPDTSAGTPENQNRKAEAQTDYWYSDIPDSKSEQMALRQDLKKEVHALERGLSLYRESLIDSTPELAAIRNRLEEVREQERARVDEHEDLAALALEQEERKQRFHQLGGEIEALNAELTAKGEFTPGEWLKEGHPVRKGCCGLHFPEVDSSTPGQRYLALVGERRNLLRVIAGYDRERIELIAELQQSEPSIRTLHQEQLKLLDGLEEGVQEDEGYRQRERELRNLRNKELYLGRVILGDSRYVRNTASSPSD